MEKCVIDMRLSVQSLSSWAMIDGQIVFSLNLCKKWAWNRIQARTTHGNVGKIKGDLYPQILQTRHVIFKLLFLAFSGKHHFANNLDAYIIVYTHISAYFTRYLYMFYEPGPEMHHDVVKLRTNKRVYRDLLLLVPVNKLVRVDNSSHHIPTNAKKKKVGPYFFMQY